MPLHRCFTLILIAGLTMAAPLHAEVLSIDGAEPAVVQHGERPTRGMSAERVEALFGEPLTKTPAVGDPPISSWDYPAYTVYFEGRYVLHAVDHRAEGPATTTPQPNRTQP